MPAQDPTVIGGQLWWDATNINVLWKDDARTLAPANNDGVASWKEQGSGVYLQRGAGGGFNPLYKADAGDGSAGIQWDGNNDFLSIGTNFFSGWTTAEMHMLLKVNTQNSQGLSNFGTGGASRYPNTTGASGPLGIWDSWGANQRFIPGDTQNPLTGWHVITFESSTDGTWRCRINNKPIYYTPAATLAWIATASSCVGNAAPATGGALDFILRHLVFFNKRTTETQKANLLLWMQTQATIPVVSELPQYPLFKVSNNCLRGRKDDYYAVNEIFDATSKRQDLTIQSITPVTNQATGNDTVVKLTSINDFSGPYHHNGASFISGSVLVDGAVQTFPGLDLYEGSNSVVLTWSYYIGATNCIRVDTVRTITATSIQDVITWTQANTDTVSVFHGRLYGCSNRMTNWATYDATGALVGGTSSGTLPNAEDLASPSMSASTAILIIRDPITFDTLRFDWLGHLSLNPTLQFQDQVGLNKIYLTLASMNGSANRTASMQQRLTPGTYSGAWPQTTVAPLNAGGTPGSALVLGCGN